MCKRSIDECMNDYDISYVRKVIQIKTKLNYIYKENLFYVNKYLDNILLNITESFILIVVKYKDCDDKLSTLDILIYLLNLAHYSLLTHFQY